MYILRGAGCFVFMAHLRIFSFTQRSGQPGGDEAPEDDGKYHRREDG
jgi:hypothetical protein